MPGSSSWMPYVPQGVKGFDDDDNDDEIWQLHLYSIWENKTVH